MVPCLSFDVSGGLRASYLLLEGAEPFFKRLVGIDDDFKFSIRERADLAWGFRRKGNFHPLAIESQAVCHIENPADQLKRDDFERHASPSGVFTVEAFYEGAGGLSM